MSVHPLVYAFVLTLCSCAGSKRHLFNGHDLSGWRKEGGQATFHVEQGCIVGVHGPGPNTFLCTAESFDDFELELQFRWDEPGNSGIQFRSHVREEDGRVEGYQCELDPSDRSWTCGIFHEGARGWLAPLKDKPDARRARRLDDWNHIRIRAEGVRLQTWLNGVPCADLTEPDGDREGFIALQVHGGRSGRMRWRDIVLTPLTN